MKQAVNFTGSSALASLLKTDRMVVGMRKASVSRLAELPAVESDQYRTQPYEYVETATFGNTVETVGTSSRFGRTATTRSSSVRVTSMASSGLGVSLLATEE